MWQPLHRHNRRKRSNKKSFTLLEIMLCLAIIALVAGALIYPLSGLLAQHRFHQGVKQFVTHLREMQALALSYQSDMGVMLYQDKGKLMCRGFTDEPIPLFRPFEMGKISHFTFNRKKANMPLKLTVHSSGRIAPGGTLIMQGEGKKMIIDFEASPLIQVKDLLCN